MPPTKRKSGYDHSDSFIVSDSGSPAPAASSASLARPNKRAKPSNSTSISASSSVPKMQKDDDGCPFWSISTARRVTVSEFKGKKMISVREYYEKDGTWLPGKKGITMTLEQYTELVKVLPQIEKALGKEGETVGRPKYDDGRTVDEGVGNEDDDLDKREEDDDEDDDYGEKSANGKTAKRSNIEATSDEEEED